MTANHLYWAVWCDAEDCNAWIGHAEGRTDARTMGWHRGLYGRDICPGCWDGGKR